MKTKMLRLQKFKASDQRGFTIMEALISAAILMIAILGASMQYVSQVQAEAAGSLGIDVRLVLNQVKAQVLGNPASFPRLVDVASGKVLSYIGCFTYSGGPQPNNCNQQSGFVGMALDINTNTAVPQPQKIPSVGCPTPLNTAKWLCNSIPDPLAGPIPIRTGGIEVHVTWADVASGDTVKIDAIVSPQDTRQFNLPIPVYSQTVGM